MSEMILGSDHSRYDWMTGDGDYSPINWAASKSVYAFLKACDGTGDTVHYADEIAAARAAGKLAAPYCWLYARAVQDPKAQADFWYSRLKDEPLIVVDFEAYLSWYPDYDDLYVAIERMRANGYTGKIMIYTGYWYWLAHGSIASYWTQFPVWLARYSTEEPQQTAPWTDWIFWQFSASGNPSDYGITNGKLAVDENKFNGTMEELESLFGGAAIPPQETSMNKVTILANVINVRSGDNTTFSVVRQLKVGNICYTPFPAKPNANGKLWVQITENPVEFVAVVDSSGNPLSKVEALPGGGEVYPVINLSDKDGIYPALQWSPK